MNVCRRDRQPRFAVCRIAVAVMMLSTVNAAVQSDESVREHESVHERHQKAVRDVGRYCENMNGRWFATLVTRRQDGKNDGAPHIRERHAVAYYSESLMYINSQEFQTSPAKSLAPESHIELISTDDWTIIIDHQPVERNAVPMRIAEGRTRKSLQLTNSVRAGSDITWRFDTGVQRTTTHEYAEPRLDENGRLVVRLARSSYVSDSDIERMRRYPILELTFGGVSGVQPLFLRALMTDESGHMSETSRLDIRYTQNSDGEPILQSMRSETSYSDKPQEMWDFRIRETTRPEWCDWPPQISIAAGPVQVQRHSDDGDAPQLMSDLPEETELLVRRCDVAELTARLQKQQSALRAVRKFVMAVPLSPPEPDATVAVARISAADVRTSNTVPLILGFLAVFVPACWLVLWFRWRSAKS